MALGSGEKFAHFRVNAINVVIAVEDYHEGTVVPQETLRHCRVGDTN